MKKYFLPLFLLSLVMFLTGCEMVVFQPEGPQARSILELINFSIVMMLFVIVVVFALFIYIVWKYRETAKNKDYEPEEEKGSIALEITWTVIPLLIVIALTIPTVLVTFAVEDVPKGYEDKEPITIHVTAADWKWIFSYPEEDIQTVNYVNIPIETPILFKLTSASTMQSFWVPQLGGQKYAMANMENELYLLAERPGTFMGRNTNFNGQGYAYMDFDVVAKTEADYEKWVQDVKQTAPTLTEEKYMHILYPGVVGRMTFNETHLQWVNHADHDAQIFLHQETYRNYYHTKGEGYEREYNTIEPRSSEEGGHNHGKRD
ncbi:cytochrome aa3 quinol oxidase subunit II [Anaerobacillus alkaliphilus]|nr:cytochrome aa3 quinol oxidase subunit II [Anaerobacillus alkaliphilus]